VLTLYQEQPLPPVRRFVPLIRLVAPGSWQALVQRLSTLWRGKTAVIEEAGAPVVV